MKKGQTSVRNGIQDFLCPFTDMNITQGSNYGTHAGTMANDVASGTAGYKAPYYAPCDCKLIWCDSANGQGMWQSLNKVRFANGNIAYATFVTAHDNTFDAKVGQVVKQGQQLGNMGDKAGNGGKAYGVHCHIEIAQNKYTISNWQKNSKGIYCFPKEYDTDACYFMDGTNILNGMGGSWKYLKDVPVEEPKPVVDEDKVKIQELEKQLKTKDEEIVNLKEDIDELKDQNKLFTTENEQLLTENVELKKKNKEMEEHIKGEPALIFTSPKTDYYAIRLEENQQLYLK